MNDLILSTWIRSQAFLARFARDDKGAALAEYGVIFLVIAIAGVGGLILIGESLDDVFTNIGGFLDDIAARFEGVDATAAADGG